MLLPAAAFAAGTLLAFQASSLPVSLLAFLALLSLALRTRTGVCIAFLSFGLLSAALRLDANRDPAGRIDRERPVEAVVRVAGHWTPDDEGWSAATRIVRLRQGERIARPPLQVILHLPHPEEPPPPFGSTLRVKGYLTRSPGFANRIAALPGPWRLRVKSRQLMDLESPPGAVARLSGAIRRRVEEAYGAAGPESSGDRRGKALARALVLGDVSGLPLEWKRGLRVTGVYHLMSVSGVHVALVAGAVWLLAGWLPRCPRLFLSLMSIFLYLLLVGPLPALVRAAVMGALAVTALLAERPPAAPNALGWAVLLLLIDQPDLVLSPAFQLTVAATAGLLLLAPLLVERWRRLPLPSWLTKSIAASVGAQLATLPWALPRFYMLPPLAPWLNLLAVPWTGLALVASLVWTATVLVAPAWAASLLPVLDFLAAPFSWPSRTPPEVWFPVPVALSPIAAWLLAAALAALLLLPLRRTRPVWITGLACLGVCAAVGLPKPDREAPELAMIDVGQGDSILLRDGERAILVDGGGWDGGDLGGRVLLPALLGEGVRHLDALVMTHPDMDHCGGLVDISAYLPVDEVWMAPGWDPAGCAGRLMSLPGTRTRFLSKGDRTTLGRWRLTVLHPEADDHHEVNERSLVIAAEVHGRRVLLTGDVESWAEHHLADCCARDLRVDVLKVAHHGSRTSSTETFLEAASPRLALISTGVRNLYHHPAPEVVERLEGHGARVLRTDRGGEILVRFEEDGRMRIETPGAPK
ncbi:MAG TPA: DNA internalization-related competence protein ComEC/Rec2 [Thermoanaerobaculia bacterium]|jgi:competence protein ComEC|nr:DNA internalization-related competence protein ComEC/Rec2 [Thermoanaerobaculia bacterium]